MRRLMAIVIPAAILLAYVTIASGFGSGAEGCGSDCASCHSITRDEAQALVRPFGADLEVLEVKPAPVRGLYQTTFRKGKDEGILYIDFEKKYLISGSIIDAGEKKDVTRDELMARKRIDISSISLENALIMGNPAGSKRIYAFTDPECPYCAALHGELTKLVSEDPQLAVYIILFPLDIHPDAAWKTESIICTSKTDMPAALAMLEQSFGKKEIKKIRCDKSYSEMTKRQAEELGVGITPTIILPDGRLVVGMKKKDELKSLIAVRKVVAGKEK